MLAVYPSRQAFFRLPTASITEQPPASKPAASSMTSSDWHDVREVVVNHQLAQRLVADSQPSGRVDLVLDGPVGVG